MSADSNLIIPFQHFNKDEIDFYYQLSSQEDPQRMALVFPHPDPLTLISTILRTRIYLSGASCCIPVKGETKTVASLLLNCILVPQEDAWGIGYPGYGKVIPMPSDADIYIPLYPASPDHTLVQLQFELLSNPPSALIDS